MTSAASRSSRGPLIAASALLVLLTLNWVAAVARFQVEGLYWDQWVFFRPLFQDDVSLLDLFLRQHGPHRQGLAFVLSAPVLDWARWDTRVEGLWIAGWLVVAAVLGLAWWRRVQGRLRWQDLWLPLALLSVRQFETVLVVPNLSHSVFPWLLLLAMAWLLTRPMTVGRWVGWGGLGAIALFTGFGIFAWLAAGWIVVVRVARAWWTRDRAAATGPLAAGLVLAVALGGFLVNYQWDSGSEGSTFPHWPLWDYPQFVARMLASRMDLGGGSPGAVFAGWVVLVLAVALLGHASGRLWQERDPAAGWLSAVLLLGAGLSYAAFTAVGRIHLGTGGAEAPRYITLVGAVWLGIAAWAAARGGRGWPVMAAVLGWSSVVVSWTDLARRPLADWPGTLGMSEVTRNAIDYPNMHKMAWLLAWSETGDWREAERRSPDGIFAQAESLHLGRQIDWLAERGLTFADPAKPPLAWLPWWNPSGVTWVKAEVGEHRRWMREEAILLIDGRPEGFLNLQVAGRAPGLPAESGLEIEFGGRRAEVDFATLEKGISLPAPAQRTKLVLRCADAGLADPGTGGSCVLENPTLSAAPRFALRGWISDTDGLWPERTLEVAGGLHRWEGGGSWVWTEARLTLRCRAVAPSFLNLDIASRYAAVDHGPVRLRVDGREWVFPDVADGLARSIPIPAGRTVEVVLINAAGARSPQDVGESNDARQLALRLTRLSLDATAAFPVVAE